MTRGDSIKPVRSRGSAAKKARNQGGGHLRPDADAAARDEEALLAAAWTAFSREVARRASAEGDTASASLDSDLLGSRPGQAQGERVVIQNWKTQAEFISLGGAEVELQPGEEVTLWLNGPHPELLSWQGQRDVVSSSLTILCEDEPLLG